MAANAKAGQKYMTNRESVQVHDELFVTTRVRNWILPELV